MNDFGSAGLVMLADGDNTLWDTDAVFANAQLKLLAELERHLGVECKSVDRLAFVRSYDQALATKHHLHLRYPIQMLVRVLSAALTAPRSADALAMDAIAGRLITADDSERVESAVSSFVSELSRPPDLLPTVRDGLALAVRTNIDLFLLTEGPVEKQKLVLQHHEIADVFSDVWQITKDVAQFRRIRQRFNSSTLVVVGDQPDRDIEPARQAGCLAALVPSRFRPTWHASTAWETADYVAKDFVGAVTWSLAQVAKQ